MDDYLSFSVSNWDLGTKPNLGGGHPALFYWGFLVRELDGQGLRYNIIFGSAKESRMGVLLEYSRFLSHSC